MFWAALAARVLLGGVFLTFGGNYFFKLFGMPQPTLPEPATQFGGLLFTSGYMDVVKVLELVGGLMVVSGRFVPLGLVILTPIAVNILLYEIFFVGQAGPGVAVVALCVALIWVYRSHFAGLFAFKPKIG